MDWKVAARIWLNMGWRIALPVALGAFGGLLLDTKIHTKPIFALVGLGIGTFISFRLVYNLFKQFAKEQVKKEKDTNPDKDS